MKTNNTPEQIQTIVAALAKLHVRTFQCESCDPKYNAQRNCGGRTYYFDEDTLRFHKSRVLSAQHYFDGLLFAAVCSDSIDGNSKRGFRYVVHDVFGTCLSRPKLEESARTRKAAAKQLSELSFDLVEHYREAINQERMHAADKVSEYDSALALLVI